MIFAHRGVPVLGFMAPSGTGKTTLLRALIPRLTAAGLRVGCVKHTHHSFEIDHPGKDSFALRAAGATQVLLGSSQRWALIVEAPDAEEPGLVQLLERLELSALDLVLVEGFRLETLPKIEVHRVELGRPLACTSTASIVALATNQQPLPKVAVPSFDLDRPDALADFIRDHVVRWSGLRSGAVKA